MRFKYEAMDHTGLNRTGTVSAANQDEACSLIRQMGFFVTNIREVQEPTTVSIVKDAPTVKQVVRHVRCKPIFKIGPFALARILPPGRFLNLFDIEYKSSSGKPDIWSFVSRKQQPTLATPTSDAVVIVASVPEEDGLKLVLTAEFRLPVGGLEYGFPAGLIDGNESPADAAKRELKEETGLDVVRVTHISPTIVSSAGMSDEAVTMVFVEAKGTLSTSGQEETEYIRPYLANMREVADLCYRRDKYEDVTISAKAWPVMFGYLAAGGFRNDTR